MSHKEWHDRWAEGRTGFHQSEANAALVAHWDPQAAREGAILVPLCGKSLDLLWLQARGHQVLGVELSGVACQALAEENRLEFATQEAGPFLAHRGQGQAAGLTILQGDVFALTPALTAPIAGLYDRAALIALSSDERRRYAALLAALVPSGAPGLLVTLDYPEEEKAGPPYAVPLEEVQALLQPHFEVTTLERMDMTNTPKNRWGLSRFEGAVWALRRR